MAIIIPSKKIYGDISHPIVKENALKRIDITQDNVQIVESNTDTDRLSLDLNIGDATVGATVYNHKYSKDAASTGGAIWGNYVLQDEPTLLDEDQTINIDFNFTSNGNDYTGIEITNKTIVYYAGSSGTWAYNGEVWSSDNYKYLTIADATVNKDFSDWIIANGTRNTQIMSGAEITLTDRHIDVDIPRLYEDYYITAIAPTLEIDYDVVLKDVKASAEWSETSFSYGETVSTRESSSIKGYFDNAVYDYDYNKDLTFNSTISITPDKIATDFTMLVGDIKIQNMQTEWLKESIDEYYQSKIVITNTTDETYSLACFFSNFTIQTANGYINSVNAENVTNPAISASTIEFIPKKIKLVYNETIRYLTSEEKSTSLTNSDAKGNATFSISDNMFLRTGNTYQGSSATNELYNNTLSQYANGKETAKLRCSIGEYYDENGNLVISTKTSDKMIFEIGDEVVPMVKSGFCVDFPISQNERGLAKTFSVVGTKQFYDGAVWQELTLREFGEGVDLFETTYRRFDNDAGGYTYEIYSNQISTEVNSAKGTTITIGE